MEIELSKRERILLLMALIVVLFFVYYRYYLLPVLEEVSAIKQDVHERQKMLENLKGTKWEMNSLIVEIEGLETGINELEDLVPSNPGTPQIIAQIEVFSKAAGVVLGGIDFGMKAGTGDAAKDVKQAGGYREIPLCVFVSGTYESILDFLRELEGSERLYNITGFGMSAVHPNNGNVLEMNIYLSAYTLHEEGQLVQDPSYYDFMGEKYGRDNPFKPVTQ